NSCDNAGDSLGREFTRGDVVEEEQRPRALNQNVVDAVVNQIATYGVVYAGREGNLQFGADAVSRCDQHWLAHLRKCAIEHAAEAADLGQRARVESRPREFFNFFGRAIGSVDVNAGVRVSGCFSHETGKS